MEEERFRKDLYYRLKAVVLRIPPLRERREDVIPLAEKHLESDHPGHYLGTASMDLLQQHDWPDNVRGLINEINVAVGKSDSKQLGPHLFFRDSQSPAAEDFSVTSDSTPRPRPEPPHIEPPEPKAWPKCDTPAYAIGLSEAKLAVDYVLKHLDNPAHTPGELRNEPQWKAAAPTVLLIAIHHLCSGTGSAAHQNCVRLFRSSSSKNAHRALEDATISLVLNLDREHRTKTSLDDVRKRAAELEDCIEALSGMEAEQAELMRSKMRSGPASQATGNPKRPKRPWVNHWCPVCGVSGVEFLPHAEFARRCKRDGVPPKSRDAVRRRIKSGR